MIYLSAEPLNGAESELVRLYGDYNPHFDISNMVEGFLNQFTYGDEDHNSFIMSKLENLLDIVSEGDENGGVINVNDDSTREPQCNSENRSCAQTAFEPSTTASPLNISTPDLASPVSEEIYEELLEDYLQIPEPV